MVTRLFLVSGASGKLGLAFVEALKEKHIPVIALSRKPIELQGVEVRVCNLLKENEISDALRSIDLSKFSKIYLIHAVGKFKFEKDPSRIIDSDGDGIDDEVFQTNVLTLKNLLKNLLKQAPENTKIKVCAFASVSDKHNIPFWKSYTKSKNIIRGYLKDIGKSGRLQALIVNVSTVDTGNENELRPNADKTYWLQPKEVVKEVLPELEGSSGYKEIDVIKEKPDFDPGYYLDHDAILEKWERDMK